MSNKYLEKAAALFASSDYKKSLSKEEKQKYQHAYTTAGGASLKNVGRTTVSAGAVGAGVALGSHIGDVASKPLAQRIARHVKDKAIINGERDLNKILMKGIGVHGAVRGAAKIAGGVLGALPGIMYADKFRHEHAKKLIEKNRNKNG